MQIKRETAGAPDPHLGRRTGGARWAAPRPGSPTASAESGATTSPCATCASENEQLQAELDQLKLRNAELEGRAAEADRLAGLLGFREAHAEVPMLAARVIGGSPDAGSHIVFLNRGSRDGLRRDMGVITPEGVVGKIVAVFPDTSQVLLLNDKDSGVGALLAGTRTQSPGARHRRSARWAWSTSATT